MKFALNYSLPALALWRETPTAFDLLKLPAWKALVDEVSPAHPAYIHFPLSVSNGSGVVLNSETKQPANFSQIESFMAQTATPLVNIHLDPALRQHPDLTPGDLSLSTQKELIRRLIRDVSVLTEHFGAEKVIAENDPGSSRTVSAVLLPEVISAVIRETGCGLLLDLAHVQLAARALGLEPQDYLSRLPTDRIGEIHISGVQYLDLEWQARLRAAGTLPEEKLARYREVWMDHVPLTSADWAYLDWAAAQIRGGAWQEPWVASCEYGGIGSFFAAALDETVIQEQIPRLGKLLRN